jgi:hypothetical protein
VREVVRAQRQWSGSVALPAPYEPYSLEVSADMDVLLRNGRGRPIVAGNLTFAETLAPDLWEGCHRVGCYGITAQTLAAFVRDLLPDRAEAQLRGIFRGRSDIARLGRFTMHFPYGGKPKRTVGVSADGYPYSTVVMTRDDEESPWQLVDDLEGHVEGLFRRIGEADDEEARQHRRFADWKRERRLGVHPLVP